MSKAVERSREAREEVMRKLYAVIGITVVVALVSGIILLWSYSNPPLPSIEGTKVLVILATGFDDLEYGDVVSFLEQRGAAVQTASFATGRVDGDRGGYTQATIAFSEVNISVFDAIFIPGGKSPGNILQDHRNQTVLDLVKEANEKGKILAAICHGPWILAKAEVVNGKKVVGHSDTVADLEAAGGIVTTKLVEKDRNIITAQFEGLQEFKKVLLNAIYEKIGS